MLCVCVCVCVSARVFYMPSKRPFSPWSQLVAGKQQAQAGTQPCGAFPVLAGCSYALPLKMSHSHATYTHTHTHTTRAQLPQSFGLAHVCCNNNKNNDNRSNNRNNHNYMYIMPGQGKHIDLCRRLHTLKTKGGLVFTEKKNKRKPFHLI